MTQTDTLFDDLVVGAVRAATGADEPTARLMLALHRGVISGDVEVEGTQFIGTPLRDDPGIAAVTRIMFGSGQVWRASFTVSGVLRRTASTASFAPPESWEYVWHKDIPAPPVGA